MLTPVSFYFLRHGETDWNARGIMQGQTDVPLSAVGLRQAAAIAKTVETLPIATVCCSSLGRARHTAEIASAGLRLPLIAIDDLKECRFGIYEGKSSAGPWREDWIQGGLLPGGENYNEYVTRALRGLNTALMNPGPVLVVAHGGTFWAIQRFALANRPVRVPNCVLFKLDPPRFDTTSWTVTELAAPEGLSLAIGEDTAAQK